MKKKLGIILAGILLVCSSSITSYADIKEGICKDTASEKILEERVLNLEELIEKYSLADTKEKLEDLKEEVKSEKKVLRNIKVEKDAKKSIKNIQSVYRNINSAIKNKISFFKSGKEKKEERANKYIASTENTIETIKKDTLDYEYDIKYGRLEEVHKDEEKGLLVIKTKIKASYSNKATRTQNYHNIDDIIKNQDGDKFKEIQYWAVADMEDGTESKVISFMLDENLIHKVANNNTNYLPTNIEDKLIDLWILPSLN